MSEKLEIKAENGQMINIDDISYFELSHISGKNGLYVSIRLKKECYEQYGTCIFRNMIQKDNGALGRKIRNILNTGREGVKSFGGQGGTFSVDTLRVSGEDMKNKLAVA